MRILLMCPVLLFILTSMVLASPLTDYCQGNVSIDYTYRWNTNVTGNIGDLKVFSGSDNPGFSGKVATDGGITVGLGNNFALQYKQFNPTFDGPQLFRGSGYDKYAGSLQAQEFNLLYKLDRNFALFTGLVKVKPYMSDSMYLPCLSMSNNTYYAGPEERMGQFGLVASTEIACKLKAYGIGALGSEYSSWQVGLAYALFKGWELNVDYRDTIFKNYAVSSGNSCCGTWGVHNLAAKGLGFGVTYKF